MVGFITILLGQGKILPFSVTPLTMKYGKVNQGSFSVRVKQIKTYRYSRLEVFGAKVVIKNFAKFTGKHLCQSLFLNKISG